ncbi:tail fiber assembly protein [Citrobacter freundii]|uniref:tail fiber assembly protein n=1 Tax=Citrobacter freundii TaxID=546 RepID=UPI002B24215F|nr:tail fiber assembly protein [Citrobacter freundii]MEB2478211.1 tail fiber assembly protein [Citrobacter freundii]
MKNIKNFREYHPSPEQIEKWGFPLNAVYNISEDGQDWYQCQKTFSPDTWKVMYDENNIICSAHSNVAFLTPSGYSVAEVEDTPEHRLANHTQEYCYIDGKVIPRVYSAEELRRMNNGTVEKMLAKATQEIGPLQDAVDIGRATEEQKALLIAWKTHRVDLIELRNDDLGKPDIKWPKPPAA